MIYLIITFVSFIIGYITCISIYASLGYANIKDIKFDREDYYLNLFNKACAINLRVGDKIILHSKYEILENGAKICVINEKELILDYYHIRLIIKHNLKYTKI